MRPLDENVDVRERVQELIGQSVVMALTKLSHAVRGQDDFRTEFEFRACVAMSRLAPFVMEKASRARNHLGQGASRSHARGSDPADAAFGLSRGGDPRRLPDRSGYRAAGRARSRRCELIDVITSKRRLS